VADTILIRELRLRARIGILPRERRRRQTVRVTLQLEGSTRRAGKSDRIEDAVDYAAVARAVEELARASRFGLIEAMAEAIATLVLRRFRMGRVRVTVEKPRALPRARGVAVTVERGKESAAGG
jgi:dihydroneopterin aldolase